MSEDDTIDKMRWEVSAAKDELNRSIAVEAELRADLADLKNENAELDLEVRNLRTERDMLKGECMQRAAMAAEHEKTITYLMGTVSALIEKIGGSDGR